MATFFGLEKHILNKGFGKRSVIYIKGCPLHCTFCPVPEAYTPQWQIGCDSELCTACGECVSACPQNCHSIEDGVHKFDKTKCSLCFKCIGLCDAMKRSGFDMDADEVMQNIAPDDDGITVSGGEPYYQFGPMMDILRIAKGRGINTAVETCGYTEEDTLVQSAPYIDTFLLSVKVSKDKHAYYTAVESERIEKTLFTLDELGAKTILRCTVIGNVNDDEKFIYEIAKKASLHGTVCGTELMKYSTSGVKSSRVLGMPPQREYKTPTDEEMNSFANALSKICEKPVTILK